MEGIRDLRINNTHGDFNAEFAYATGGSFWLIMYLWMVQYNCYRQFVEKRHCTCGKLSIVTSESGDRGTFYTTEEFEEDYSALTAVFTMYALTMMDNENNHAQG
ncbi:hypothetical protein L798_03574 [Zootermopsis nevadensis]|uniref:Uncharacterized protein n=1 Tax=Zootermopsis nevadensis TaxID=136037 RepID=A0A067QG07_ZOONE|nr:hypothetical protein L798_03574 [Zootermopsis nevadensis]